MTLCCVCVCVCEAVAESTHDDPDDTTNIPPHLLTDDTTAHSDVAVAILIAGLYEPDVDEQTQAIPSSASTLPSGHECEDKDEGGSYCRLEINIQ